MRIQDVRKFVNLIANTNIPVKFFHNEDNPWISYMAYASYNLSDESPLDNAVIYLNRRRWYRKQVWGIPYTEAHRKVLLAHEVGHFKSARKGFASDSPFHPSGEFVNDG